MSNTYFSIWDLDFFPLLEEDEAYMFVIQARNAYGYGEFSEHVILPNTCAESRTTLGPKDDWRFDTWNNRKRTGVEDLI